MLPCAPPFRHKKAAGDVLSPTPKIVEIPTKNRPSIFRFKRFFKANGYFIPLKNSEDECLRSMFMPIAHIGEDVYLNILELISYLLSIAEDRLHGTGSHTSLSPNLLHRNVLHTLAVHQPLYTSFGRA